LIYTDPAWINSFRKALVEQLGIPREVAESIGYSEQGLQGDTYVNLDCGAAFYDFINTDQVNLLGPPPAAPVPKLMPTLNCTVRELEEWLEERRGHHVSDVMSELMDKVRRMVK
jgi:hypothetical protein